MLKQLTLSKLLTLGIAQASLTLLSLNRKFQHDNMHSPSKLALLLLIRNLQHDNNISLQSYYYKLLNNINSK